MLTTIGFLLALADFTDNTARLERGAGHAVEELRALWELSIRAIYSRNAILFGMLIGTMPGLLFGMMGAGVVSQYLEGGRIGAMPDSQFWPLFLVLFVLSTFLCAAAFSLAALTLLNTPLAIAKVAYWVARLLSYPRKGLVGTVGLLLASVDFVSYWTGRLWGG